MPAQPLLTLWGKPQAPTGDYELEVGMYLLDTMKRLDVTTAAGKAEDGRVVLTPLHIQGQRPSMTRRARQWRTSTGQYLDAGPTNSLPLAASRATMFLCSQTLDHASVSYRIPLGEEADCCLQRKDGDYGSEQVYQTK